MDSNLSTCPRCSEQLNDTNRLIRENCGHIKCRNCLIKEEIGCKECLDNNQLCSEQPTDQPSKTEQIQIIDTIVEQQENVETKTSLTEKTNFPSHIVKETIDGKTKYNCLICKKSFSRSQQYYHKFCGNTKNKPYKCGICQEAFSSSYHLKYHAEGHEGKKFKCDVCNKQFLKLIVFKKHKKIHKNLKKICPICGNEFKDEHSFKGHMSFHENIFPFSCDVCKKKFTLKNHLTQHSLVHSRKTNYECSRCGKKFVRSSTYKIHMIRHSKTKNYSCAHCPKKFFDKKTLDRHQKIHEAKTKYQCKICDISSLRKDNITRHLKNMHSEVDVVQNVTIIPLDNVEQNAIDETAKVNSEVENLFAKIIESSDTEEFLTASEFEDNKLNSETSKQSKIHINSSVIRCVGNVEPVIVPKDSDIEPIHISTKPTPTTSTQPTENVNIAVVHKKLKKKYDPCDIYRQILLASNDDDIPNQNTSTTSTENKKDGHEKALKPEENLTNNQSNFTETHWRKNFKFTYQYQYD